MSTVKYGVWFLGDNQEREGVCYQGRSVFIADTELEAALYKEELESYSFAINDDESYNDWNNRKFKVYKLEIEE